MNRCYNCGLHGHGTKTCPRHGPYWPEPGKTRDDYTELIAEIQAKVAADIVAEHEGHGENSPEPVMWREGGPKKGNARTMAARKVSCPTCQVGIGEACISKSQKQVATHMPRVIKSGYGGTEVLSGQ